MIAAPRRLTSYVARSVLLSTLAAWAVLLGFVTMIDFVSELRDVGKESYTLSHAVLYMLLTTPRRMYELFPTIAVIGSLLGLGGLAARSELTVMRAVGLSKLQMGGAALVPLLALTALIGDGRMPGWLGLWWVHLPMVALALWLFLRDGRLPPPEKVAA